MQSILMNISETLNIEYFFANLFKKAIAFSYQPLSCTRGLVLTPQEDPTRTNQEIIVELTKSLTGGNFSYQPGGNGRHGYRSSEASKQGELPKSQDELEPRTMKHSFDHALIPLQVGGHYLFFRVMTPQQNVVSFLTSFFTTVFILSHTVTFFFFLHGS